MPDLGTFRGKARDAKERDKITKKCYNSKAVQDKLKTLDKKWLYDGGHIAWYAHPLLERKEAENGALC